MDNYRGELADILGSSSLKPSSQELSQLTTTDTWQLSHSSHVKQDHSLDDFGNPFCTLIKDPLFEDLDVPISNIIQPSPTTFPDDDKYSDMIQISADLSSSSDMSCANSSSLLKPLAANHELICNGHVNHVMFSGNSSGISTTCDCFMENRMAQISAPQYTGIKRRKGQGKKVVCIPAPTPVNSRPTGEIVPSDLWAWRKYGQKPIKGSPYPRGYYRCSSSKGCSARKQVERSRTDPNMLVITYTSEHNHPWPTQRNALAGSTRNNPSKTSIASATNTTPGSNEPRKSPLPGLKEEHKDVIDTGMEAGDHYINHPDKDFLAELGEMEGTDPLELMFTQGFTGEGSESHKASDPYGLYEWSGNSKH